MTPSRARQNHVEKNRGSSTTKRNDNNARNSGAVYVFARNGSTWTQQTYIKASNTKANDSFGYSVAASGDTLVVGAFREASNATGINGNESDTNADDSGAAYIFTRRGTSWTQQAYLKASNSEAGDLFGVSVAVSGDTVVVGSWGEDSNAVGINGNQNDNSSIFSGVVYFFVRDDTNWMQQAYLKSSNTRIGQGFGRFQAISSGTLVAGAFNDWSDARGVNGSQTNTARFGATARAFINCWRWFAAANTPSTRPGG